MKSLSIRALLALSVLLAACQRPEEPVPPQKLLPKPDFARLLIELHVMESRVDAARLSRDSSVALFEQVKDSLLRSHQTTDSAFQQTYRYYSIHGKDLQEVYDVVIDSLNLRGVRLQGKSPKPTAPRSEPEHLL